MKNNILCIDWSNIVFRSLYSINGFGSSHYTFNNDEEINSLIARVGTDVAFLLRIFNPDKIVFAADAKNPWRKDILETYKSGRDKDETLNWKRIYAALDDFKDHLIDLGYVFIETERAEADDLMALTKEIIFQNQNFSNYNLIIISADADIRQLIEWNPYTKQYCMVFNEIGRGPGGKRHLYCNQEIMDWYQSKDGEKVNIFNFTQVNSERKYIQNILDQNKKIVMEVTDPKNILLSKVFCGDDGDAVPAFYDWYSDKGKKVRVTNSKFVKILESLNAHDISLVDAKKKQLKPILESVCKRSINDINVEERLERQEKLVQLSSEKFPVAIQSYKVDIEKLLLTQPVINCSNVSMKDLIKDTKYDNVIKTQKAKDADIFKDLNKYIDNLNMVPLF